VARLTSRSTHACTHSYPLRGAKFSNWQGGIRVPAFVSGGFVPTARRGLKLSGMATLWDVFATFGELGGLSSAEAVADPVADAAGLPPVDSIAQWGYWSGATARPPRTELAIGGALGNSHGDGARFLQTTVEGLISDDLKLLLGEFAEAIWTGPHFPNTTSNASEWLTTADCRRGCLFNLTSDPTEHDDIAAAHPEVVARMLDRIRAINATVFSPVRGSPDPRGCEVAVGKHGGFWGPFL
jgi:arylsulfatase B